MARNNNRMPANQRRTRKNPFNGPRRGRQSAPMNSDGHSDSDGFAGE
jgi:hypothetical protein